jgi:hypothetical protein
MISFPHQEALMEVGGTHTFAQRMMGAALLDINVYEEVEHDTTATSQAAAVVAIVAVCMAIGSVGRGTGGMISGLTAALIGWAIWSGITYLIGANLFGGTATWGELLRTIGFAFSPGVLFVVGVIPILGALAMLAVSLWILVSVIIAIRQALDFSTGKAVLTAVLGWIAWGVIANVVARVFNVPLWS